MKDKTRESETQTNGIANSSKCGGIFPGEKWLEMKIREATDQLSSTFHEQISSMQQEIQCLKTSINKLEKEKESLNDLQQVSDAALEQLQTEFQSFQEENTSETIREVQEDSQSIKENIWEMLQEVPKVALSSLESRFSNIEDRISMSENTSVDDVHSAFNNASNLTLKSRSETIKSNEELMIEVADEVNDRQKRKKSIVIHNIAENENEAEDEKQVINILKQVVGEQNDVEQQKLNSYRLGKKAPGKIRTIKIHFKSEEFCQNILQHTGKLRENKDFEHIVFQPDLTPLQRQHLKMLVEEKKVRNLHASRCNEEPDWIIRRGKLCRRRELSIS